MRSAGTHASDVGVRAWVATLIAVMLLAANTPAAVQAQDEVESSPKGTIGAALIGAELGAVIPALAGVDDAWPYIVFPVIGAGAGVALGALVVDQSSTDPAIGVSLLVLGTAGLIPALVVTFAATAYDPDDDNVSVDDGFAARRVPRSAARSAQLAARAAGPGLVRVSPAGLFVGAPGVVVAPPTDRGARIEVPFLSGLF